jgi:hypothetical protein
MKEMEQLVIFLTFVLELGKMSNILLEVLRSKTTSSVKQFLLQEKSNFC